MSKTERKKLFQPIPLSAILDPTYQSPFSKLEKFQVDMEIPRSKMQHPHLQQSKVNVTMWQKLQSTLFSALSNFVIISQPVLTKAAVASRPCGMSLVPWRSVKSCDLSSEDKLDLSPTKPVPESSSIYHSIRNGLTCLRYLATTPLREDNLKQQSHSQNNSSDPCKQNKLVLPVGGLSFGGGGLFFPIISDFSYVTSLSAPPSPSHHYRAQLPVPNLFALAMSGLLVASPQNQYNSFYKDCLLTPVIKGAESVISASDLENSEDAPDGSAPNKPTRGYCGEANFEILIHSTLSQTPVCSTNSKPYTSLPATPLKSCGAMETLNPSSGCVRFETNWKTISSKSGGITEDARTNFHSVSVCSSSRKGNTVHIACSTLTSSPRNMANSCMPIPRRRKTESESSTDSFIEFSASVESTDSFCIVFEAAPGCIEEDLDREIEDDDDDWEDEDDEDESDDDDDDRVFNYCSSVTDDLFVDGDCFQPQGGDALNQASLQKKKAKTVSFDEEHLTSVVEFEDDQDSISARETYWEMLARDRARFQDRIYRTEDILSPILMPCHRAKIFQERFVQQE